MRRLPQASRELRESFEEFAPVLASAGKLFFFLDVHIDSMYSASMIRKELVAASAEPLILSLLDRGESYGYAIIQEVKARSGGKLQWTDGMLYPVLHRLEQRGLIKARWGESETGRKRKYYSLKKDGKHAMKKHQEQWSVVHAVLSGLKKNNMFDLENSIAQWRTQMQAAGIKTSVPLEELELHLREEIDRLMRTGLAEQAAFEISVRQLGQPQALKTEFKKNSSTAGKKLCIAMLTACVLMVLRVLYRHHQTGPVWKNDQIGWILFCVIMSFWAGNSVFFNFSLGDAREIRLWKLAGITYSMVAVWVSVLPMLFFLTFPKFNAAFSLTERVFVLAAAATSILSVFGWQWGRKFLPVVRNGRTRTMIGLACCVAGPGLIALFIAFIMPHRGNIPLPLFFVLLTWLWTFMAILAGAGYGLGEAARRQTTAITS